MSLDFVRRLEEDDARLYETSASGRIVKKRYIFQRTVANFRRSFFQACRINGFIPTVVGAIESSETTMYLELDS